MEGDNYLYKRRYYNQHILQDTTRSSVTDLVDKAINRYKNHPSILLMKQKLENVSHVFIQRGLYK